MTAVASPMRGTEPVRIKQTVSPQTVATSRAQDTSSYPRSALASAPAWTGRISTLLSPRTQRATRVSSPNDPAEREAEATARKVMRMSAPPAQPTVGARASISRAASTANATSSLLRTSRNASSLLRAPSIRGHTSPAAPATIQRQATGRPVAGSDIAREIQSSLTSGEPLPEDVRSFMEPRFRANFAGVRIHTGEKAARLAARLAARAFTFGKHIFFGRGQFRPNDREGVELIAHELTHTIQQREVIQRQEEVNVTERAPTQVQRLGVRDALNYFADAANAIPGFRMFTIVLGINPINMSRVERSAANIMRAVVEFIPGGNLITRALDTYGVFDRVGAWVEGEMQRLGLTGTFIRRSIDEFLDSLSWRDIFNLSGVWNRARSIFTDPIGRIITLARGLLTGILGFLREAVLRPLARLAEGTRGYDLLKAVLGQDPITGEAVPRTAETLIGGFMKLIGQEEVWNNLKRANAVARAWAWFQGALSGVMAFVRAVPGMIVSTLRSITLEDFLPITNLFGKVGRAFAGFLGSFFSWAGQQVMNLLQIIFEVVAPAVMPYIRRAAGAFRQVIQNPVGFVRNLVRAGIQGFRQFAGNFLNHLRRSLIDWLTGTLSGASVYIPQAFTLPEIIKFVLSVLGLTWQNIRQKLVRVIGEPAVRALEAGFEIVRTLVTRGPAAAWEQIQQGITNLREMVMEQVMSFVQTRIVQAAITRLVTSLNPAGAFIQAIIAIYNTVMFLVERLRQIARVLGAFIDSMAAIASGNIGTAASRVETTMGGMLTLVISFLARLIGLGNVSQAVTNIINRVRQPIDRALDRVVNWIVTQARRLGRLAVSGARAVAQRVVEWWRSRSVINVPGETPHTVSFRGEGRTARPIVASTPQPIPDFIASVVQRAQPAQAAAVRATAQRVNGLHLQLMLQIGNQAPPEQISATMTGIVAGLRELLSQAGSRSQRREEGGRNVAIAFYRINGQSGTLAALSGNALEFGFFAGMVIGHPRHEDTEIQLLENIARRFADRSVRDRSGPDIRPRPEVRGFVHLTSDFVICASCSFVIGQFRRLFPNVTLVPESNENLPPSVRRRLERQRN